MSTKIKMASIKKHTIALSLFFVTELLMFARMDKIKEQLLFGMLMVEIINALAFNNMVLITG